MRWRDAWFEFDRGGAGEEREDFIVETVGWTEEGERFLTIVSERTPDGHRALTHVPVENVVERVSLRTPMP